MENLFALVAGAVLGSCLLLLVIFGMAWLATRLLSPVD